MWAKYEAGNVSRIYKTPQPLTVDGVQYPSTVFNDLAKLREWSIYPLTIEDYDTRYYRLIDTTYTLENNSKIVGTITTQEKDIDSHKSKMIQTIKQIAESMLTPTDWMVIRAAEGGDAVPSDISEFRASVRETSNEKESEVNALTSMDDIIDYENKAYEVSTFIEATDEEGNTTVTPEVSVIRTTMSKVTNGWPKDPNESPNELISSIVEV